MHDTNDAKRVGTICAQNKTGSPVLVYRLYGHYSFNARDGGEPVSVVLSNGYSVGEWLNGARLIIGPRVAVSVEQAIHHGYVRIVRSGNNHGQG